MIRFLRSGKVKDLYDVGNGRLLMVFTDRLSSHDVMLADQVPHKGEVLCRLSAYCFQRLELNEVPTHLVEVPDPDLMLVQASEIIPVEVVCRNYIYGSYWKRLQQGAVRLPEGAEPRLAARLPTPIIEFTTKFEAKDRPIDEEEILVNRWLSTSELSWVKSTTEKVNRLLCGMAAKAGFLLADFKLEYARRRDGSIVLADEVGTPDGCRFWEASQYQPGRLQDSFDKQVVRDYLERVLGWDKRQPEPGSRLKEPILPEEIVTKTSERYVQAFERLTGLSF
ncbi:MAG: phosphoribosylaminoimidazolesuccinocarboxamide synthase [Candidatus Bathyarchaeia archaeon]